jgi:tetratricopeptide (TPR) repeat protein
MALYDAFISYSHAKDKPIAAALQSVVQKLGKPWYRRRALRVFRDDTSLSATPHLWPTIEQALGQSRFFILLASPEAAASKWVNKEVAYWLEHNGVETLLIGVTDGVLAWDEAIDDFGWRDGTPLPPVLTGRFSVEPKWVGLTAYRDGADQRDAKFIELGADFAAAIRGMPKEDLLSQEVRQQRRALTLAWSAAGALLLLATAATGAGVLAYRAQQQAVRAEQQAVAERDTATRNFKLAQKTADSLVFDIARGLRDVEGMRADAVRKILETAKATFEQLAAAAPDDLELQRSRSVMLNEFGETYLTLGNLGEALKSFRDGLAIRERLAKADPNNAGWQRDLSVSRNRVGDVLVAQGDLAEALKSFREGLAIAERLAKSDPDNAGWQRDLTVSYERVGDVLVTQGDLGEALKSFRDGLAIRERLAKSDPDNAGWQRDLTVSYDRVGDVQVAQGNLGDALKSFRHGLAIRERLATSDPNNAGWQRDLTVSYERVGNTLVAQSNLEEALQSFRADLAITERLAKSDPNNAGWQRDLAISHGRAAPVLRRLGKVAEALAELRQGQAILARLVEMAPGFAQWKKDLAWFNGQIAALAGQAQEVGK